MNKSKIFAYFIGFSLSILTIFTYTLLKSESTIKNPLTLSLPNRVIATKISERKANNQLTFKVLIPTNRTAALGVVYSSQHERNKQGSRYYLDHQIKKDLWFSTGSDSIAPILVHHEPTYGMGGFERLLVAFDLPKSTKGSLKMNGPFVMHTPTTIYPQS